jgi:hypothetical protein
MSENNWQNELSYNLNHVYTEQIGNAEVAIGAHSDLSTASMELFDKSLALTSDLKRLPVIRSVAISPEFARTLAGALAASGIVFSVWSIAVWNGEYTVTELDGYISNHEETEHGLLWHLTACIFYNTTSGIFTITYSNPVWPYRGGILAENELTLHSYWGLDANVAGTALPADTAFARFYIEVDWVPVSKKEFEAFVLEAYYARDKR